MTDRKFSKVLAMMLSVLMLVGILRTTAFATIGSTDKGTITINGLEAGVKADVYKILDVNFDFANQQPQTPMYKWNTDYATWVRANYPAYIGTGTDNTVQEAFTGNLPAFYDALANAVRSSTITTTKAGTGTAATGTISITNLEMGNYFIIIEGGMKIYRPSAVNLAPTFNEGTNEWTMTTPATVIVKATEPTIDKTINEDVLDGHDRDVSDSANIGEAITFNLQSDIPNYPANAIRKGYKITDTMSNGLTLDTDSIKVYGSFAGALTLLTKDTDYTQTTTAQSFVLTFDYDKIKTYDSIQVLYVATLNENAVVGTVGNTNTVKLEYSNDPYGSATFKEKNDEVKVYTYGIDVTKTNNAAVVLPGAKFELRKGTDGTGNALALVKESDGNYRLLEKDEVTTTVTELEVSPAGKLYVKGLDAGDYNFKETVAPSGYNLLAGIVVVTIADADFNGSVTVEGADLATGIVPLTIVNSKGFQLPITGGMGTVLFSVFGILFMAVGALLIVVYKKHRTKV